MPAVRRPRVMGIQCQQFIALASARREGGYNVMSQKSFSVHLRVPVPLKSLFLFLLNLSWFLTGIYSFGSCKSLPSSISKLKLYIPYIITSLFFSGTVSLHFSLMIKVRVFVVVAVHLFFCCILKIILCVLVPKHKASATILFFNLVLNWWSFPRILILLYLFWTQVSISTMNVYYYNSYFYNIIWN